MELINLDVLKNGLVAGSAVAALSGVAVLGMSVFLSDLKEDAAGFAGKWAVISLVFGMAAAVVYQFMSSEWSMGGTGYLGLAVGMAVALTAMEFLPLYGGGFAPHWQTYAVLNFVYAVGFGTLIPRLFGQ